MDNEDIAYAMADAYKKYKDKYQAVKAVNIDYPDIPEDVLYKMWSTIDAYVDLYL